LYCDEHAEQMAGQHGMALATRFCERSPQLGGMVASRTWHLDTAIANFVASGGRDIAIVGVGWDMRPFRLALPEGTRIFELDFPTTLAERARRLAQLGIADQSGVTRIQVPIDVRTMALAPALADRMDANAPIFVAWEGMNMYFQEGEVRTILEGMKPLLQHADSLLWVDLVDRAAIEHPESYSESVRNFMRGMQILGEPFTFGPSSIDEFMRSAGLRALEIIPSDVCLGGAKDPVYEIYKFCVAASANGATKTAPLTFRKTRVDRKSRSPARPHSPSEPAESAAAPRRNGRIPKPPA
jgi:methyltransferase (TIGR00027 family)